MSKHLADHRAFTSGERLKHFLRLARSPRATFHRRHTAVGKGRLAQFLRIERGIRA